MSGALIQHHYATRAHLLLGAFAHTVEQITTRLQAIDLAGPVHEALFRFCCEVLPLDDLRRRECIVWAAFSAAAASHPELAEQHARAVSSLTDVLTQLLSADSERSQSPATPPATAAVVLAAVLDALRAAITQALH